MTRHGKVNVRTIAGLKRADVIRRRINCDFADPLELNPHSRLGVPGLVEAMRAGSVVVANALGSGVLEASALISFMPRLCRLADRGPPPAEYRDLVVRQEERRHRRRADRRTGDHGRLRHHARVRLQPAAHAASLPREEKAGSSR